MKKFTSTIRRVANLWEELFTLREYAALLVACSGAVLVRYLLEPSRVDWGIQSSVGIVAGALLLFVAEIADWKDAKKQRREVAMKEANSR
ncbi:MAG: hypothetical protein ACRDVF_01650 [Microbacterium sp.]|uniref:hypothetical protein n=1 Tax=Microbacterium sp. TaxID=51671 RepID=UPI003D6F6BB1